MSETMTFDRLLRDAGMRDADAEWFMSRVKRYPFTAQSPTSVKPPIVPGDHVSTRLRTGWRIWGFTTELERDTFVMQFGARVFP